MQGGKYLRENLCIMIIPLLILPTFILINPTLDPTTSIDFQIPKIPNKRLLSEYANKLLANTPCLFTENCGQLDNDEVMFYTQGGEVWFTDDGVWLELREYAETRGQGLEARGQGDEYRLMTDDWRPVTCEYKRVIIKQEFVGANLVRPEGRERTSWNSNFFYGNDSSKWCTDVPNYQEIYYENLWDGIDIKYYANDNCFKYDFIVHPDADVSQIRIRYEGVDGLEIDRLGNLIVKTPLKNIVDGNLFIYQNSDESVNHIKGRFVLFNKNEYGFKISKDYRKQETLIIDPEMKLEFSTYLGGNGEDGSLDIGIDPTGNTIITGWTEASDFPTTTEANDTSYNGGDKDIFIFKINSSGSELIYSTFVGGNDGDNIMGLEVDKKGNCYATGGTQSSNFPIIPGAFQNSLRGVGDVFVLKLSINGSELIYSTFIGGSVGGWEFGDGIAVDFSGNAYITGWTNSMDFPNTTGAYDRNFTGTDDSFILKLNQMGSQLIYSTYIGGNKNDWARDITLDSMGNAYVTGHTNSTDFPTTDNAFDKSHNGTDMDCFVLKLNQTGSKLIYSTYIGGDGEDTGFGIIVDSIGNAFITGITMSSNFPITLDAFDISYNGGESDVFVLKLNHNSSAIIYSTFVGGNYEDSAHSIVIDFFGNAFVTGRTKSLNFPTTNNSYDQSYNGDFDAFMFKLNWNGSKLIYSTYLGGNSIDLGLGIAYDPSNNIYITGFTNSSDFIKSPEAYQSPYDNKGSVFVQKFSFHSIVNITSLTLLENSTPTNLIYSRFSTYTFKVDIINTESISDLELVRLNLDPGGLNTQLLWTRTTGQFTKFFDPKNYIILEPSSNAYNDSLYKWTINFDVIFNWNYPDESFHDIQAYASNSSFYSTWLNATGFYCVENDLVFNGTLSVTGENNRTIKNGELVQGGEKLNWTGLTVVYENTTDIYPPNDEFNVTLWNEEGNSWIDSPLAGENFTIDAPVDSATDLDGNIHTINITGIPLECDKTNQTFTLRIDGDNITFLNPIPGKNSWQTTTDVEVGINIIDIGGGLVNGSSVKYCISNDNGTNWSEWIGFPRLNSGVSVNPKAIVSLPNGRNNFVKWQATDSVGNGPTESEEYLIIVDTEDVIFSNGYPTEQNESLTENVQMGITIFDKTSGVDIYTVEYAISINSGASWTSWKRVPGLNSGNNINAILNLKFPNGTANRIKWRASDVAGNGPTESEVFIIRVNTWLEKVLIPEIKLWNPPNGSVISSTALELSWQLLDTKIPNVYYDIYLDTAYPPVKIIQSGVINTTVIIDNLSNGETYFWTVIPRTAQINGTCESGVWSFTVNIPIPKVNLISPKNNSVINEFQPRLSWGVDYDGTEILSYNVYFGTSEDPELEFENHPSTSCFIKERLTAGETYYWKIVPWAGNIQGPVSETWPFTVKQEYIPHFELELFVSPPVVELPPGDIKRVRAIVRNLGELEDSILLRVEVPLDLGFGAMVDEPCILGAMPNASAEFYITVTTSMDPQKDEINLTVIASSRRATEYELTVEETAELTVKILSQEKKDEDEPWLSLSEFWIIFLIIIIILIVLILVWTFLRHKKRSQETKEESTAEDALTVKPGTVPKAVISVGEAPPTVTTPQLPEATGDTESGQQTQAIAKVPTLASSTAPGQIPETQQIPSSAEVPQLPAAQVETESGTVEESTVEASPTLDKPVETQQETDQDSQ